MKTSIRTQFYGTFIHIAQNQWESAKVSRKELDKLIEKMSEFEGDEAGIFNMESVMPAENEIYDCCIIIIVSTALGLEGYIYDYSARNLSDNFAREIDKLDAVSKWLVIPQLITGKKFPKDGRAYQLLKQLVQDRNYLAHPKSTPYFFFNEETEDWEKTGKAQRMEDFQNALFSKAQDAILAIEELALVIEDLDTNEHASHRLDVNVGKRKEHFEKYGL